MVLVDTPEIKEYIAKARENLQETEMYYILFHDEAKLYIDKLVGLKDQKLADTIAQYQAFNLTHFNLKLGEALKEEMTTKDEDIELFKNNPKFAHLNLHQNLKLDQEKLPKYLKDVKWTFPALALLTNNSSLFNNLVSKYKPMLGMIFKKSQESIKGGKDVEFASNLHALIQHTNDPDLLFNALENHSSLFTFEEVYMIVHNSIAHGKPSEIKILNSVTVRSWFDFINDESKIKWIEEMFDAAEENKDQITALGDMLILPTYHEKFKETMPDEAEAAEERKAEAHEEGDAEEAASDEDEDASEHDEAEDEDENEEEDENEDESGDAEEAQSADEDEEEGDEDADEEENEDDEEAEDAEEPSESAAESVADEPSESVAESEHDEDE